MMDRETKAPCADVLRQAYLRIAQPHAQRGWTLARRAYIMGQVVKQFGALSARGLRARVEQKTTLRSTAALSISLTRPNTKRD